MYPRETDHGCAYRDRRLVRWMKVDQRMTSKTLVGLDVWVLPGPRSKIAIAKTCVVVDRVVLGVAENIEQSVERRINGFACLRVFGDEGRWGHHRHGRRDRVLLLVDLVRDSAGQTDRDHIEELVSVQVDGGVERDPEEG